MIENPYNEKTQPKQFHAWQHGFNSQNEFENPYQEEDDELGFLVWQEGYEAKCFADEEQQQQPKKEEKPKKKRGRPPKKEKEDSSVEKPKETDLSTIDTEKLQEELLKRKKQEHEEIGKQIESLEQKRARLEVLLEDEI